MGAILSRFRKEKTTFQILEKLDEDISDIEAYTISTQERRKRFVGNFLVISIGLYVLASCIFYFLFFPSTWNDRMLYSLLILIIPLIVIWFGRNGMAWFFERKVFSNSEKLKKLRAEKKKILEKVMDKETYKVAVDILNKFGDKTQRAPLQSLGGLTPTKQISQFALTPKSAPVNQRALPVQQMSPQCISKTQTPLSAAGNSKTAINSAPSHFNINRPQAPLPYRRTPYPIIDFNKKSVADKMVDYLIGDGPSNRFALICKDCLMHNGMALLEEYEYAAFRCPFCGALNPAKKQRPTAPKLPFEQGNFAKTAERRTLSTSSSDDRISSSSSDSSPESKEVFESQTVPNVTITPQSPENAARVDEDANIVEEENIENIAEKPEEVKKND